MRATMRELSPSGMVQTGRIRSGGMEDAVRRGRRGCGQRRCAGSQCHGQGKNYVLQQRKGRQPVHHAV